MLAPPGSAAIEHAVQAALAEDVGTGDATTLATVPESATAVARMNARSEIVVAGLALAEAAFRITSGGAVDVSTAVRDGERVAPGTALCTIRGPARPILTAERVALNFVQRLSGVATLTAKYVEAVRGTSAQILDTRKTTPGLRIFEKYAVQCGGGRNHRFGLHDMILIKDNHLEALRGSAPHPIAAAIQRARAAYPKLRIEIEADTLDQADQAAAAGADIVLLDNMTPGELREAVARIGGRAKTEASGGITLETVRAVAESGVDFISVGALTHSAPAVDIGLDFESLG